MFLKGKPNSEQGIAFFVGFGAGYHGDIHACQVGNIVNVDFGKIICS